MFHFHNKKAKQRISSIIIILLVLAMVLSTVAYFTF